MIAEPDLDFMAQRHSDGRLWRPIRWQAKLILLVGVVFGVALVMRVAVAMSQPLFLDELFSHLAAQSLASERSLRIYEGFYTRASAYTHLAAWAPPSLSLGLVGERLPAAIFGAAMVAALFAWLSRRVGLLAALIGASMLAISDVALKLSAYVRFYTLHALLLLLTAIIVFEATRPGRRPIVQVAGALATLPLVAFATHLQPTSLIFAVSLCGWLVADIGWRRRLWLSAHRFKLGVAFGLAGLFAVLASIALWHPFLADKVNPALAEFFGTAAWNRDSASSYGFYLKAFLESQPGLLFAFPVCLALAIRKNRRLIAMSTCVFAGSFLLMSVGGMKNERYLFFAMPFFYIVVATGLAEAIGALWQGALGHSVPAGSQTGQLVRRTTDSNLLLTGFAVTLCGVTLLNSDFNQGRALLTHAATQIVRHHGALSPPQDGAWTQYRQELQRVTNGERVVLTTDPFRAVAYLGHYDVAVVSVIDPGHSEFVFDPRSGRPSISTGRSLAQIQACYRRGVLLLTNDVWPDPTRISESLRRQLEQTTSLALLQGRENNVFALSWDHAIPSAFPTDCAMIKYRLRHHSAADPIVRQGPLLIP